MLVRSSHESFNLLVHPSELRAEALFLPFYHFIEEHQKGWKDAGVRGANDEIADFVLMMYPRHFLMNEYIIQAKPAAALRLAHGIKFANRLKGRCIARIFLFAKLIPPSFPHRLPPRLASPRLASSSREGRPWRRHPPGARNGCHSWCLWS